MISSNRLIHVVWSLRYWSQFNQGSVLSVFVPVLFLITFQQMPCAPCSASPNWVFTGLDKDVSPVQCQSIISTTDDFLWITLQGPGSKENIEIKIDVIDKTELIIVCDFAEILSRGQMSTLVHSYRLPFHQIKRYFLIIFMEKGMRWVFLNTYDTYLRLFSHEPITLSENHSLHDYVIKWKHFPCYWPFVRGIHRSSVNSSHKGQWRGALMFSVICAWINGWVNNREAGDLRRHRAHYDVKPVCNDHL